MLGSEYASYFDERIFLNGVDRENEACLDCVQFGESGYVTAREKPSHHQGNERTHHRPMFPPAVPSSSRWLQSFEGRVSSFWAVTSQPGKSPERVPPIAAILPLLWVPTGQGLSCHAGFGPCRCHLSAWEWPLPSLDSRWNVTAYKSPLQCRIPQSLTSSLRKCPPPFIEATVSTTIVLILGNILASPPH